MDEITRITMMNSKKTKINLIIGLMLISFVFAFDSTAQIGLGRVAGIDFYQHHRIPDYNGIKGHSTGSAVANIVLGPKVWVGGRAFSVSAEAAVSFAPFAFDTGKFRGMGVVSFPISVDLNFLGLSGFSVKAGNGFSLGGGISFNKADLYFVNAQYEAERDKSFYKVYFGQIAYGVGSGGNDVRVYVRYGQGENSSYLLTTGILLSTNYITGKKKPLGE